MMLREELEFQGNWLFRWRSYLPTLLILPSVLAIHTYVTERRDLTGPDYWALACLAVSLFGLLIRMMTVGYVPKGTSGRNTHTGQIAETLNTTGMYSLVRHPLYVGNFVIWFGISMFPMQWWLCTIFALVFWLYYERIVYAEEAFLERKFGDQYRTWAAQTPTFIPRLRGWRTPSLAFSFRNVLRREYSGLLGIVSCFYGLEVYTHLAVDRTQTVHPLWTAILIAGAMTWFVLRTLKKTTRLLEIAGR